MREELEARKDPLNAKLDHREDETRFEISLINAENEALTIDCLV